jgi:hypothetical protein
MASNNIIGYAFFSCSIIALGFLSYSILNMQKLNITLFHPRIIVEFTLFFIFIILGIIFIRK